MKKISLFFLLLFPTVIFGHEWICGKKETNLLEDLEICEYWNKKLYCERFPSWYNHLLYGGYISMPSARMGCEGEMGSGFAYVPPYRLYNLRFQLLNRLEVSFNYRVFKGVDDPLLSHCGFGDLSDKGANIKYAILLPEDSDYKLPGVAFGFEDFIGTCAFRAKYLVFTKVFKDYNLELSLGIGGQRIRDVFGGFHLMPFFKCSNPYIRNLCLVAEYDATPYKSKKREPHPDGRVKKNDINWGLKYRLWDAFDFSVSRIRGVETAYSISTYYNLGTMRGFVPKIDDPLPYRCPINTEPLGPLRPELVLVEDLYYALCKQGFDLMDVRLECDPCCQKVLRIRIFNDTYLNEPDVRCRLNHLLAYLIPSDIDRVIVVMDADGFPMHEYDFYMPYVRCYGTRNMGYSELKTLSPMKNVSCPFEGDTLYWRCRDWYNIDLRPKTHLFFGSATGKFKYTAGVHLGITGYICNDIYYSILLGYNIIQNLYSVKDVDKLNPSQLINVRTDIINYYKQDGLTFDELFIQKNWTIGKGFFSRLAVGYFEEEYAGGAVEFLYYPTQCNWAVGIEGAVLRKRTYSGLGFTDKVRKLKGFQPTFHKFIGSQYFLDMYYDWKATRFMFKIKMGRFLARDWGIRYEVTRYYKSGFRLYFWYTRTNGNDRVNGHVYYDKGVGFSMPLDIFYTKSCRKRFGYAMSAWLRDVGVTACTGKELYDMIHDQRE